MKILLRASLDQYSGYGRDGIGLALALLARGHYVRLAPVGVLPPLPREVAGLLVDPLDGNFDLALHHTQFEKTHLRESDAAEARVNVFWGMWSFPRFPDEEWVTRLPEAVDYFDHLVVYDPVTAEALRHALSGTPRADAEILQVLGGYTAADWDRKAQHDSAAHRYPEAATRRAQDAPFRFGMNGRLTIRKGYLEAYRAFNLLKERHGDAFNAELVLRSTDHVFPPNFPLPEGVSTILSRATPADLLPWYQTLDTLLAPSNAEGKHLPPIEALTLGVPVILSDIPGHRLWATNEMVTWLPVTMREIQRGFIGGVVDHHDLADAMWEHYTDPGAARRKADVASRTLPAMLDWSKCLERLGYQIRLPL